MPLRPESRSRARTRSGVRPTARRLSPCYRHPDEPIAGICASCLRERLSGLDSSIEPNAGPAKPVLRRCRSVVSSSRCEASSSGLTELRRKSCDVVSDRSSLSNLFDVDDLKCGSGSEVKVETKNVGLSRVTYTVIQSEGRADGEIRVSGDRLGESDEKVEDEEFKTMKEYIDLEFPSKVKKSKDLREIAGNFLGAASVFTKKLRKWRQKDSKAKKNDSDSSCRDNVNLKSIKDARNVGGSHSEVVGRRSCDTEPRFSVDGGRISFEEPRASWDGYMIARTIPRLAPMFSVVEDGILGNVNRSENRRLSVDGPMHSIVEDESSSAASGSGHSNSDSSSSRRQSSFDRSSSVRSFGKKATSSEDHGVCPANVKLVITEKELKDWRLTSSRDDVSKDIAAAAIDSVDAPMKKPAKWRRVRNLFGLKAKNAENLSEAFAGNTIDPFVDDKQGKEARRHTGDANDWKLTRSSSIGLRNSGEGIGSYRGRRSIDSAERFAFMGRENFNMEGRRSVQHPSACRDSGSTPPFYLTPLRSLRNNSKQGKLKLQSPHGVVGHVLQLN